MVYRLLNFGQRLFSESFGSEFYADSLSVCSLDMNDDGLGAGDWELGIWSWCWEEMALSFAMQIPGRYIDGFRFFFLLGVLPHQY